MPLFGKKKETEKKGPGPATYPTAQAYPAQPTASSYPTQGAAAYPAQQYTNAAPPPYTPQGVPPPQQPAMNQPYPGVAGQMPPQQNPQYGVPQQVAGPSTVVVQGGFDAGARFDITGPSLPPPPPGCLPTASQVAAAQGHNVVVTQRKGDFVSGGSDGGMVIW